MPQETANGVIKIQPSKMNSEGGGATRKNIFGIFLNIEIFNILNILKNFSMVSLLC